MSLSARLQAANRRFVCSLALRRAATIALSSALLLTVSRGSTAQDTRTLHGEVRDPVGALIPNASVELLTDRQSLATTSTGPDGSFRLELPAAGRYRLRVSAPTFQTTTLPAIYLTAHTRTPLEITLATQTFTQQITVTATGTPTPEAQIAASISVLPEQDFRFLPEIQQPLRLVPGLQVTQNGEMGGTSALRIRGANPDSNKVLLDGVPANSIGGAVEFANLASLGFNSIEILREPNSALYGSDALAGVVSLTTARGASHLPLFTYAGDAGNFGAYRNELTAGTAFRQFDLYSAFARIDTRNNLPNSQFHNATYAGNFGWTPNPANDLRFTLRHLALAAGQPNAVAFYGIPAAAQQQEHDTYLSAVWNNQTTLHWHNQIRYGGQRLHGSFNNFGATGIPDGFGDYDGKVVTITGANGYSVTGQAYMQYGNTPTRYLELNQRDFVYAQTDYTLSPHLLLLAAFKFEHESGSDGYTPTSQTAVQRGNYSYTLQLSGELLHHRLFYNAGTGLEENGLFGFAGTPRASLAYYLFPASQNGLFSGTKLHGTFGKGIKEPSLFQQADSLYAEIAALPTGVATLAQYRIATVGPVNSRTFDAGLDQQLVNGRARIGATYFHNQFTNVVEYVPTTGLIQLGVPKASLTSLYGAYVNSLAYRTQGLELESEIRLNPHLFLRAGYTFTDALVQHSFAGDNLKPTYNTASTFPTVQIGAYSPLVGSRPFRVAPHSGYFDLTYTRSRFYGSLSGSIVGKRDDSTFLSDANFSASNPLLLPNRNLLGSYQRLTLGGGYQLTPRLNLYTNLDNLLSEHYFEAFGYPALPFTFRSGLKLNFGGESWKLH